MLYNNKGLFFTLSHVACLSPLALLHVSFYSGIQDERAALSLSLRQTATADLCNDRQYFCSHLTGRRKSHGQAQYQSYREVDTPDREKLQGGWPGGGMHGALPGTGVTIGTRVRWMVCSNQSWAGASSSPPSNSGALCHISCWLHSCSRIQHRPILRYAVCFSQISQRQ